MSDSLHLPLLFCPRQAPGSLEAPLTSVSPETVDKHVDFHTEIIAFLVASATVAEKTLIVPDLEVVQVVYEPAALCSETIQ